MIQLPQLIWILVYDDYYNYILTAADIVKIDNDEIVEINLLKPVNDELKIEVHGKFGELRRDFNYRIKAGSNNILELLGFKITTGLYEDDKITIAYYREE